MLKTRCFVTTLLQIVNFISEHFNSIKEPELSCEL